MISFVVPCYNEEKRLPQTFILLEKFFQKFKEEYEVIFINDGSSDKTKMVLANFIDQKKINARLITYTQNHGKGYAVKRGMLDAKGAYALMMDCDLATDLSEINKFVKNKEKADILVGVRTSSKAHRTGIRKFLGKSFSMLHKVLINLDVTDTQCGFKMFNKSALSLFAKQKIERWSFDIEILYLAKRKGMSIKEIPVKWEEKEGSKVKPLDSIKMFFEVGKIRFMH
jgi:dolichyl-phosphate beta-glucosyltransferase